MTRKYSFTSIGCKVLSFLMLMFVCLLAFIAIHYMKCENVVIDIIILFSFLLFSYAFFVDTIKLFNDFFRLMTKDNYQFNCYKLLILSCLLH
jgi:hypothetical protein